MVEAPEYCDGSQDPDDQGDQVEGEQDDGPGELEEASHLPEYDEGLETGNTLHYDCHLDKSNILTE